MLLFADAMFAPTDYVHMYLPTVLLSLLLLALLLTVGIALFLAIRKKRYKKQP